MDLGISGKRALVCGASTGLGYACAEALAAEGVHVTLAARREEPLMAAAEKLSRFGVNVSWVAADVSTDEGRAKITSATEETDILINNAGGPPPGQFRDWSRADWIAAFDSNMLSAVFLTRAYLDGMIERKFGRIVNISSIAVKQPLGVLGLSTSARLALTGFASGLSRDVAEHNVTINNLLPGYFSTARLSQTFAAWGAQNNRSADEELERRQLAIPAKRFGNPTEFGHMCAFLCSEHASYMTGQNVLLDGGLYPGIF
jgi:3-oxoacyl-[acyl-carrier protein] reductase